MDPVIPVKEFHIASQLHATFKQPFFMPPEIWINIFMLSLPPMNHAQAPPKTALALVCPLWNAIVESTPILWSRICIADTISYVRKSLSKSGEHPIDVYGARSDPGRQPADYVETRCQFFQEVNCHARRWRHVVLQLMYDEGYAPSITFFPLLESLQLHSYHFIPVREEYVILLNNARTPHLREVLLDTARLVRWDISFPPNLYKLEIRDCLPSLFEVLSILAACPNLAVLCLDGLRPCTEDDGMSSRGSDAPFVELAVLQKLQLRYVPALQGRALLTHLRFPEDCTIYLRLSVPIESALTPAFWTPALSLYHERFQRAGQIDHVTISVSLDSFSRPYIRGEGWRGVVDLRLHSARQLIDALKWFGIGLENNDGTSHFEPSPIDFVAPDNMPITTLEFHDTRTDNINLDHLTPFLDLQCINRIDATSLWRPGSQVYLLSYLSNPPVTIQPTTMAACSELSTERGGTENLFVRARAFPRLRELVLKVPEVDGLKAVIDFVKSRSGDSTAPVVPRRPARLKRIEFVDEYDEDEECDEDEAEADEGDEDGKYQHPKQEPDRWNALLELLDVLDEDAEVIWCGERICKLEIIE